MKPLDKEILRLSVPSILAGITVPLVGLVDLAVAGHIPSSSSAALIGGVTIGGMLFDLLYWNFAFLREGTGGLTAQAFGRGDMEESASILSRSVITALFIALAILILQWPFAKGVLWLLNGPDDVKSLAFRYFRIRIWAAPATLILMAVRGWFIGMQDSFSSMIVDLVVNGVNILASITLSFGIGNWAGFGFDGIALGTLIAQYSGLLAAAIILFVKFKAVFKGFRPDRRIWDRTSSLAKMNIDLLIRSICLIIIYIGFTSLSAGLGERMLACGAVLMKLLMFFSYFTDGFAYAGEALTGRYIGMGDKDMTKLSVRRVAVWSLSIGMFFIAVYALAGKPIIGMMTSDEAVRTACSGFLPWLMIMPPVGCLAFTWDGVYVGAAASRQLRNSSIISVIAFFGVFFSINALLGHSSPQTGLHILLAAYFAHLLARSLYQSFLLRPAVFCNFV